MKHWLTSTYSKQIAECRAEVDTKGYLRNKVASVAVGRCVVAELRCSFAALFAQDAARVMRRPVATRGRCCAATLPRCCAAMAPSMPHRLRIGHGYGHAVNATATATLLGICATPRCHGNGSAMPQRPRCCPVPTLLGICATAPRYAATQP